MSSLPLLNFKDGATQRILFKRCKQKTLRNLNRSTEGLWNQNILTLDQPPKVQTPHGRRKASEDGGIRKF